MPLASLLTLPESLPQPSPGLADSLAAREGGGTKGLARGSGLTEPADSDLDSPLSPRWRPFAPVEEHVTIEKKTKTCYDLRRPKHVTIREEDQHRADVLDACLSTACWRSELLHLSWVATWDLNVGLGCGCGL